MTKQARHELPPFEARQCKAARALLGWSQADLAASANIATSTVADFERGARVPIPNNLKAIRRVFREWGIRFPERGVTLPFSWGDDPKQGWKDK